MLGKKKKKKSGGETFQFSSPGLCTNAAKFSYWYFFPLWHADLTNWVCRNMSVLLVCLTETRLVSNWNTFVFPPVCRLSCPGSHSVRVPPKRYFPAYLGMDCAFPFKTGGRVSYLSHSTLGRMDFSSHFPDKFFRSLKSSLPLKQFLTKCRKESVKLMGAWAAKTYTRHLAWTWNRSFGYASFLII